MAEIQSQTASNDRQASPPCPELVDWPKLYDAYAPHMPRGTR